MAEKQLSDLVTGGREPAKFTAIGDHETDAFINQALKKKFPKLEDAALADMEALRQEGVDTANTPNPLTFILANFVPLIRRGVRVEDAAATRLNVVMHLALSADVNVTRKRTFANLADAERLLLPNPRAGERAAAADSRHSVGDCRKPGELRLSRSDPGD